MGFKRGKYFRVGHHDIWYGYEGSDKNTLLCSRYTGEGVHNHRFTLRAEAISCDLSEDGLLYLEARLGLRKIALSSTPECTTIRVKWGMLPLFQASGREYSRSGRSLINTILTTNGLDIP